LIRAPHLPLGFTLEEPALHPPLRHEVFVTSFYTLSNEDLAIIKLWPQVHKDDFGDLATEIRSLFRDVHQVRVTDI